MGMTMREEHLKETWVRNGVTTYGYGKYMHMAVMAREHLNGSVRVRVQPEKEGVNLKGKEEKKESWGKEQDTPKEFKWKTLPPKFIASNVFWDGSSIPN